ncbi:hypothetical protein UCRPA7_8887 [Phaeoacremonium minimum UCRPA7]|uniref:Uncharacterized protein n=1 Tax=Phaeoacremonium minimum (strain UCR-PA7) TaxID=1286976 RepID=R8B8Y9_PHAM7|nr:hypothetical protein UCRPA7_8887 [Phaeoacremonium minimum UCRPA7]EON95748.1 hypothetical protein UCRPA7_8887 [Phaeoacremonium minimum UCRPA7]
MAVTTAVEDLFKSFYELFASIFNTIYNVLHAFVATIVNFFVGILNLVRDVLSGVVDIAGGLGKFVAGNIVLIGIVAAGGYLFVRYQAQQGKPVKAQVKKTN